MSTKEKNNEVKLQAFANRLATLLEKNDITQAELSRKMDVTRASVNFWCKGETYPKVDRVEELAGILKVHPAFLLYGLKVSEPEVKSALNVDVPVVYKDADGKRIVSSVSVARATAKELHFDLRKGIEAVLEPRSIEGKGKPISVSKPKITVPAKTKYSVRHKKDSKSKGA